ncbi:MAG TPA: Ppx/GppA phosphatase family protein [Nitrospiria bacterium]
MNENALIAGIDVGTNAVRLLVARVREDPSGQIHLERVRETRRITRLGGGLIDTGRISPEAMARTIGVLKEFREIIAACGMPEIVAVGTSAVREAENGGDFVRRIREETGLEIEVITGDDEARRTLVGVRSGLGIGGPGSAPPNFHAMDIGGGSTEWIVVREGRVMMVSTMETGVVKLSDRFLKSDPLSGKESKELMAGVRKAVIPTLDGVLERFGWMEGDCFVGTAGTVTTLAALELEMEDYDPEEVHNSRLSADQVRSWYDKLVRMTLAERRGLPGLETGREDLIIPGSALLLAAMERMKADEVVVCDWGLREGIVIDRFNRNRRNESFFKTPYRSDW